VFLFILEYRDVVLSRGMQHEWVDKVIVLISWPKWDLALRDLECTNKPS
jgi:hypothetical protein